MRSLTLLTRVALCTLAIAAGCRPTAPGKTPDAGTSPDAGEPPPAKPTPIAISSAWANEGGDKVTRDELRVAKKGPESVYNSVWRGSKIVLFGAQNEVVSFNL